MPYNVNVRYGDRPVYRFIMQETIRAAGIRAVTQQLCYTPEDVSRVIVAPGE